MFAKTTSVNNMKSYNNEFDTRSKGGTYNKAAYTQQYDNKT